MVKFNTLLFIKNEWFLFICIAQSYLYAPKPSLETSVCLLHHTCCIRIRFWNLNLRSSYELVSRSSSNISSSHFKDRSSGERGHEFGVFPLMWCVVQSSVWRRWSLNTATKGWQRERGHEENGAAGAWRIKVSCVFTSWCIPDNNVCMQTNIVWRFVD